MKTRNRQNQSKSRNHSSNRFKTLWKIIIRVVIVCCVTATVGAAICWIEAPSRMETEPSSRDMLAVLTNALTRLLTIAITRINTLSGKKDKSQSRTTNPKSIKNTPTLYYCIRTLTYTALTIILFLVTGMPFY